MGGGRRCRIAVLGGGAGAISAVFHLTQDPNWRKEFEITVYESSWRLGGKGASGRNPRHHERIEEHGLHVWPGFYHHAFSLIRECYAEWDAIDAGDVDVSRARSWTDSFRPQHEITLLEHQGGTWRPWIYRARPVPGQPGDVTHPVPLLRTVAASLQSLSSLLGSLDPRGGIVSEETNCPIAMEDLSLPSHFDPLFSTVEPRDRPLGWHNAIRLVLSWVQRSLPVTQLFLDLILWAVDHLTERLDRWLRASTIDEIAERRWLTFLDLMLTTIRGLIRDQAFVRGLDSLDSETYLDWLHRHGASPSTRSSPLVRGLHDFVFARDPGKEGGMNLAAGVAIRLSLLLSTGYRGAILYKLTGGMGDMIFAPLYQVLKRRGVQFRFFHQVLEIATSPHGKEIDHIVVRETARGSDREYDPLIMVRGNACWPSSPRIDPLRSDEIRAWKAENQTVIPSGTTRRLAKNRDFDLLVCGLPLDVMRRVAPQLAQASPAWQAMFTNLRSTATVAAQFWMKPSTRDLGWIADSPIASGFDSPGETWCDMSHTLPLENWPERHPPGSVAYLCGAWPTAAEGQAYDRLSDDSAIEQVWRNWYQHHAHQLWPHIDATSPWFDSDHCYLRYNVAPSERYILSLAGTTRFRIAPDESGFRNLFLAGDWTRSELNVGCVEGAVQSGRAAARGILQAEANRMFRN